MLKITPALIDAFTKNLTEREYSPATISKYAHDARALMEYAPDGIADKAQPVGFRSWLERRGYSGASVNSMLGAVNALLVYIGTDWLTEGVRYAPHNAQNVVSPDTPMLCRAVLCFYEDASGPG